MTEYPNIIPYHSWIHSQLSVARHYGGIKIGDKQYVVDYIFAKEGKDGLCFPDLVEEKTHMQMQKDNPEITKAYYAKCK